MTDADTETEAKTDAETNAAQAEKEAAEREALKAETVANAMKGTWLSISDAAKKYGKKPTRQTITTWIRDEIIPAAAVKRDGPRKVFVEASELDRVIESWKAERKSKASTNIMIPGREDAAAIAELKSEVDKLKAEKRRGRESKSVSAGKVPKAPPYWLFSLEAQNASATSLDECFISRAP